MKKLYTLILLLPLLLPAVASAQWREDIDPRVVAEFSVGTPINNLRSVPVQLDASGRMGVLVAYCEKSGGGGPNTDFFTMPKGTLSLVMFDLAGKQLWRKDLGKNVIANVHYVPVLPFDLDGDGAEEVWFINNTDLYLPFRVDSYIVQALDPTTGDSLRSFPWQSTPKGQPLGNLFRNFLMGTRVGGAPVLVTGQGTYQYGPMALTAYDTNLNRLWRTDIPMGVPGPRGSHMSVVIDIDMDGDDEILWGERCVRAKDGSVLFMPEGYTGHTDITLPVMDWEHNKWTLYCCRENGETPRLVYMDDRGKTIWSDLKGHIDRGWVARFTESGERICTALEIARKFVEDGQLVRTNQQEFAYELNTGKRIELPFKKATYAAPVDFNGDGIHELYLDDKIYDVKGRIYTIRGTVTHASHFMKDYPGEQIIAHTPDGTIRIWANAAGGPDSPLATRRYEHRFYKTNQKLTAVGYNRNNMSGL